MLFFNLFTDSNCCGVLTGLVTCINDLQIDREFHRISTLPLLSTFYAALDQYTPCLMEIFRCKGGAAGRKIRNVMLEISKV